MSLELLSFTLGITVNKLLLADEPLAIMEAMILKSGVVLLPVPFAVQGLHGARVFENVKFY